VTRPVDELELTLPSGRGIATYPPGATFGPRTMRDWEFVWIIEGDVQYTWGGQTVDAPQGSIVLCRPGAVDFFRWDTRRRTRHAFYHFDVPHVPAPPAWPVVSEWPLVRQPARGEEAGILIPMFRHLLTQRDQTPDPELTRLTILHMLRAFVTGQTHASDVPQDALPDAVDRAGRHIVARLEADPASHINLQELADVACVTPEHLCRLFKSALGTTPVATVRLARLDHAAVLLARSNYSVAQIAVQCGFASPFHFSRAFKQVFGQSPRALRRALLEGQTPPLPRLLRFRPSIG